MAELLRVVDLVKQFPVRGTRLALTAVNGVSLDLAEGETLGIVGESGSGKTTLGRCILRLQEPTRGRIYFMGQDITRVPVARLRPLRAQMQIVYQNPWETFNPRMTVRQIIEEPLLLHTSLSSRERAVEVQRLAQMVGFPEELLGAKPENISAGDQQRAAIARAIATRPKLIVLDEPTSSLDLSVRTQIIDLLVALQQELGLSYIFISHDLTSVLRISRRVAIMYLAQILEMGPTEKIFGDPQHPYSRALISSVMLPDPWASRRRLRLAGEIPSPINLPVGCPLASRCPLAEERCWKQPPPRVALDDDGWWAACHPLGDMERGSWEERLSAAES